MDDEIIPTIERVVSELIGHSWNGPAVRIGVLATNDRNAYVLASGRVYITSGMLDTMCTTDEIAAVVAHELAHLESNDDFDLRGRTLDERLHVEADADCRAAARLINAGYEPLTLARMVEKLRDEQPEGWSDYRCRRLVEMYGKMND